MATPLSALKLGLRLELYRAADARGPGRPGPQAEALGYHSVWTAEAYGTDALTPLAYIAARHQRIKLGTGDRPGRRPAADDAGDGRDDASTRWPAAAGSSSVSASAGRRSSRAGTASRGASPTRGCATTSTILRQVLDREGPVAYEGAGDLAALPRPGRARPGQGAASILHPSSRIPIWLAAGGQRNIELAAELADGWLPMGLGPGGVPEYATAHRARALRSARRRTGSARVVRGLQRRHGDDHRRRARRARCGRAADRDVRRRDGQRDPQLSTARPWPGAGSPRRRRGSGSCGGRDARRRRSRPSPTSTWSRRRLLGSPERIRRGWEAGVAGPGVTGLIVGAEQPEALALMADLAGTRAGGRCRHERRPSYETIAVDTPGAVRPPHHAQPAREAQRDLGADARGAAHGAARARTTTPRCGSASSGAPGRASRPATTCAAGGLMEGAPIYSAPGDGQWARQANDTWFAIWDLANPVIAQIHGYAIAGGTELASACDLVYVAATPRSATRSCGSRARPTGSTTPCCSGCAGRWS